MTFQLKKKEVYTYISRHFIDKCLFKIIMIIEFFISLLLFIIKCNF